MGRAKSFLADTEGATAVEYGLIAAIISVALIGGFGALASALRDVFNTIAGYFGG
ncbi:Flp family type IVb pilin [Rhizobium sp. BK251]|uniref:Flp family type IVb pilin n=1 Tax=Rhizobium sp. BK251 TaxID=2512125 RepID=UPI00104F570E|nr:Flp family type IVb pilin [Rhizobium sp. BK251]TCL72619.1 pilus assembly protein Flp/PilA [Rhizobium sp. BK251]